MKLFKCKFLEKILLFGFLRTFAIMDRKKRCLEKTMSKIYFYLSVMAITINFKQRIREDIMENIIMDSIKKLQ